LIGRVRWLWIEIIAAAVWWQISTASLVIFESSVAMRVSFRFSSLLLFLL
jgi:hypothetical protein